MSLREIGGLLAEEQAGTIDAERSLELLGEHRGRLAAKADELERLVAYLDAKIGWILRGPAGPAPEMGRFLSGARE